MKSEKRMVGDYTVLCAVNIGSREIILAENEQDKNGDASCAAMGSATTSFSDTPNVPLATIILMRRCSLRSASRGTLNCFGQRLRSWIFP